MGDEDWEKACGSSMTIDCEATRCEGLCNCCSDSVDTAMDTAQDEKWQKPTPMSSVIRGSDVAPATTAGRGFAATNVRGWVRSIAHHPKPNSTKPRSTVIDGGIHRPLLTRLREHAAKEQAMLEAFAAKLDLKHIEAIVNGTSPNPKSASEAVNLTPRKRPMLRRHKKKPIPVHFAFRPKHEHSKKVQPAERTVKTLIPIRTKSSSLCTPLTEKEPVIEKTSDGASTEGVHKSLTAIETASSPACAPLAKEKEAASESTDAGALIDTSAAVMQSHTEPSMACTPPPDVQEASCEVTEECLEDQNEH
ncbi:hypothetical protein MRB53_036855 [Persea americana]|nr:hypothetical protein MRB53_036855 [Persea americana]